MTRKHFTALARALAASRPIGTPHPDLLAQWHDDCDAVAKVCASFNPGFDRARFLAACQGGV